MANELTRVLGDQFSGVVFDKALAQRLIDYTYAFVNKNPDHVSFFGSALVGVYTLRWLPSDTDGFFDFVLNGAVDELELRNKLRAVKGIEVGGVRGNDELNHAILYCVHRLFTADLPEQLKYDSQLAGLNLIQYKFLSSLMFRYYQHKATMALAMATYNALSRKFDLRVAGSWGKLLEQRSQDTLAKNGIHRKTIATYEPLDKVLYWITDTQGRLRSVVKNISTIFYGLHGKGETGYGSESAMGQGEDGTYLKDKVSAVKQYQNYLVEIINDEKGFVRRDLLKVINGKMPTARDWLVEAALKELSKSYGSKAHPEYEKLTTETLLHAFDIMVKKRIKTNDYPQLIDTLKKSYMASRESSPAVLEMRRIGDDLIRGILPPGKSAVVAPERGAMLLYIVLRTLTRDHF